MSYASIIPTLLSWWYTKGVAVLVTFLGGLFLYLGKFFSLPIIIRTFFSPWKKMVGDRKPGFDGLGDWLTDNLVSRGVGMMMRLFLIFFFFLSLIFYFCFVILSLIFWLGMPVWIIACFIWIFEG